jgi:cysteine desulfurase
MQVAMGVFGNPSSLHAAGCEAAALVEQARAQVAEAIAAEPEAVFWTSGATESNNLAIQGAAYFYARQGKHMITMQSEHKAVTRVMAGLESDGFDVTYLRPGENGLIDLAELEASCRSDTRLISVMWVNNETGVIQPIKEIACIAKRLGVLLHVDAAQALGKVAINLKKIPVDLLSLAAHKYYGPKGVGVLYVRQNPLIRLQSVFFGSRQEGGIRPGTVATHQVVGMGAACTFAKNQADECKRIQALKDRLVSGLKRLSGVGFYAESSPVVSHCVPFFVQDIAITALLERVSDLMIATGSACNSATLEPSSVLLSMGIDPIQAYNSGRISLGRYTTEAEIDQVIRRFSEELVYLRGVSPVLKERVLPVAPYLHAYELKNATHRVGWESQTENARFVLFLRVEALVVQEFSFLVRGSPIWFSALESFSSEFAGSSFNELSYLTLEKLMQVLKLSDKTAHVAYALLSSIKNLVNHEEKSM